MNGDQELLARLGEVLGPRHRVCAGAVVTDAGTRVAARGADVTADFELGSVSKALTGLLYCDALARSEVEESTTLGELLALGSCPAAAVSLAALSTHRSGLPRLPGVLDPVRRTIELWRNGSNPYGEDLPTLLEQARRTRVRGPRPRYSNLGFELLGHALASAARTTYPDLVRRRLAEPLGLPSLNAPANLGDLRPAALAGRSRRGRPRAPWTGEAIAPAGGLRASITDMGRLAGALLDGSAPGRAALAARTRFLGKNLDIGAAWITLTYRGREITWHNGATGGFRSWIGLDLPAGAGVVLLSATCAPLDRHGFGLLAEVVDRGR